MQTRLGRTGKSLGRSIFWFGNVHAHILCERLVPTEIRPQFAFVHCASLFKKDHIDQFPNAPPGSKGYFSSLMPAVFQALPNCRQNKRTDATTLVHLSARVWLDEPSVKELQDDTNSHHLQRPFGVLTAWFHIARILHSGRAAHSFFAASFPVSW